MTKDLGILDILEKYGFKTQTKMVFNNSELNIQVWFQPDISDYTYINVYLDNIKHPFSKFDDAIKFILSHKRNLSINKIIDKC